MKLNNFLHILHSNVFAVGSLFFNSNRSISANPKWVTVNTVVYFDYLTFKGDDDFALKISSQVSNMNARLLWNT